MRRSDVLLLILILFANILLSQNPEDIINKSIAVVKENDKKIESLSGNFKLKVKLNYELTVKKGSYEFVYDVKFKNGMVEERKLVSAPDVVDSSSLRIAKQIERVRQGEYLKIENLVFPFLRVRDGSAEKSINYKLAGSEKFNGKDCFVITVDYKVKSDTAGSKGNGKIWIDKASYVPIRCEYDVTYESKRFGKNQNKQFLDLNEVETVVLPARNVIHVFPKVLFVKFGKVEVIYETYDFKFEK
jgi:outer membrane lipoprotein-sorting protein